MVKMSELGREGRTVVFVSHDLGAIGQLSTRALWTDQGGERLDGPTQEVLDRYLRTAVARAAPVELAPDPGAGSGREGRR